MTPTQESGVRALSLAVSPGRRVAGSVGRWVGGIVGHVDVQFLQEVGILGKLVAVIRYSIEFTEPPGNRT